MYQIQQSQQQKITQVVSKLLAVVQWTLHNLTVNTAGNSSAAIRTDRGGGTVVVDKGTYTSTGYNSPAVYSTANITVKNATLNAENSEALVIEGQNSITLENTNVTGNMSSTEGSSSDNNVHNVMIYQSMSGDAESGTATFTMKGGTLTGRNGDQIYVTNTHSVITLEDVTITNQDSSGRLLAVLGNDATRGWGTAGANGGQVDLTTTNQTLTGRLRWIPYLLWTLQWAKEQTLQGPSIS